MTWNIGSKVWIMKEFGKLLSEAEMNITELLIPWNGILLWKLTLVELDQKFLVFYGTRRIITVFTRARRWFLS
jgi:hypothetical protein